MSGLSDEYDHTFPTNHHGPSIIHCSSHLEPLAGPLGHSLTGDFENDEAAPIAAVNCPSWDGLQPESRTSINGGTFIGGNLNHVQYQGDTGECQYSN
jgi:hypothetical protein